MDFFPIILVIHLLLAVALVGIVLLQRSEGGALGIGGGGGGLMTGRAAGNLLTRTTGILAGAFFLTSLALAIIANNRSTAGSAFEKVPAGGQPAATAPAQPAAPAEPAAPIAK
jgi:preprotein translocase subunit SecG